MLKLRRSIFPKNLVETGACAFVVIMIPLVYWFEVFIIFPDFHEGSPILHTLNFIFSTFLLLNIVGNMVAVILLDTSIAGELLPSSSKPMWLYCEHCESWTPPRSWHCDICGICILKRDHHCNFTGCCIGHNNQRYFVLFLFYFAFSTAYATLFNIWYTWNYLSITGLFSIFKFVFPVAILLTGLDASKEQYAKLIIALVFIGLLTSGYLLVLHVQNVFSGKVMYERGKKISTYDTGNWKENIELVFGKRWYLTWILPFISSELPIDGLSWEEKAVSYKDK